MEWSSQQADALLKIQEWLIHGGQQVFRLFGHAGTGKTTLAREVLGMVGGRVMVGAFTGKAALVLRRKGLYAAQTLHSMIYKPEEDFITGKTRFVLNPDADLRHASLLIVDEVSMVGDDLGADIMSFGTRILVLGDPGQLPPIRGQGFFIDATPDILLTEIHRQAADNPIIRLSMDVREGKPLTVGAYGESRILRRMDLKQSDVMEADQVIVGMNKTRRSFNRRMREILGYIDPMPVAADRLICLKNDRDLGLLNGGMWKTETVECIGEWVRMRVASDDDDKSVRVDVLRNFFDDTDDQIDVWKRKQSDEFTYAYAITCHKSQGSEWPNITVFDESGVFRADAIRWLYTAITRAADRITIVI